MAQLTGPTRAQNVPGSNIVSRTFLSPDGARKVVRRVYDNGLGDVVQEVQSWPGSSLPSLVVHHEYDELRRRTRTWLPVMSSGSGFIGGGAIASQAQSQYSDAAPFSRTEYDGFLPSQPSAQYKAGAQWQGNGKKMTATYSEYVGAGMFSHEDGYMYMLPGIKYLCTGTVDEDGCPRAEYTDLYGRPVISETSQGRTYYIYNETGDVTYVIPPILSAYILSHYGPDLEFILDSDGMMQKYAYIYRYDRQRHCIYKKLPGCEPIYYVYDRTGACILTQDGNQRPRHEWTYTIPDRFGRPCISGVCSKMLSYTTEPLRSSYVYAEYDGTSVSTGGYAVHNFALGAQTLHSAAYYDSRYNVAQVKSTGGAMGDDITCTEYSYTGKPLSVKALHTTSVTGTLEVNCTYTYDGADRPYSCTLSVANGGAAASTTLTYTYDDLGRLSRVTRPFTSAGVSKYVTYTYDLHGWTTGIATNSFLEELFYAGGPGTPRWNGNVSAVRWKDKTSRTIRGYRLGYDGANRLVQAIYGQNSALTTYIGRFSESFGYDSMGNVTGITRSGKTSSGGYGVMDNLTLTYDGNRLTGVTEAASDYDFAGSFEYRRANGSQYMYDANGSLVADRSRGIAYVTYDANGNPSRIYFTNGNVTKYKYSASGQKLGVEYYVAVPNVTVPFGAEPDALTQGQVMYAGSTQYLLGGSLVVKDGMVDRYLFDGGYAKATAVNPTTYSFALYYYNRDHLGNIREVVDSAGTVKQVTNYYPSGTPYADPAAVMNAGMQPYKYNGKELDRMHGLDTYDYGARQYDPILGRWDRMDPLCEKYYDVSPYAYCHDNPINRIDPDGRDDYYSSNGDFMYRDSKDTDRIMMTRWTIHVDFKDGEKMVAIGGVPIEKKDDISAETYSNIFTDIVSKMPDVDLTKLRKEHISVIVWNGIEDGKLSSTNTFNRPDEESGKLASTGNTRITASINLIKDNRIFFSTVSNIQSILGIHEYKGHFVNHMGDESKTHHNIYEMQMNDPTWNKITDDLKENIINNYMKYLQDEK